jgi:hypothetical protein
MVDLDRLISLRALAYGTYLGTTCDIKGYDFRIRFASSWFQECQESQITSSRASGGGY